MEGLWRMYTQSSFDNFVTACFEDGRMLSILSYQVVDWCLGNDGSGSSTLHEPSCSLM